MSYRLSEYDLEKLSAKAYRKRVKERVEQAIAEAYEDIDGRVRAVLDRTIEDVVPALLGLRYNWGKWELNRTNGIDREHPLGVALREEAQIAAERVVTAAIAGFTPTRQMMTTLRKEYTERLLYSAREAAGTIAAQNATAWAEEVVATELSALEAVETWNVVFSSSDAITPFKVFGPFRSEEQAQDFLNRYSIEGYVGEVVLADTPDTEQ